MRGDTCRIEGCTNVVGMKRGAVCAMHRARIWRHGNADTVISPSRTHAEDVARFWAQVDKRSDDECWPFLGVINSNGYGQFTVSLGKHHHQRRYMAHRFAYEIVIGPIPEGLHLDHVWDRGCTLRECVNPAHLEPVTLAENNRRMHAARKARAAVHCGDSVPLKSDVPFNREVAEVVDAAERIAREAS